MDELPLSVDSTSVLVCPETKRSLTLMSRAEAERVVGGPLLPLRGMQHASTQQEAFGGGDFVLVRDDQRRAYPVVCGVPLLLVPEMLGLEQELRQSDLEYSRYAEAYDEMTHYNHVAAEEANDVERSESYRLIAPILGAGPQERGSFPEPKSLWIDAIYDCASQWDVYQHLAPLLGKRVLQIGGKGMHAVKFLLAGAREAWMLTPMLGEALYARALAKAAGVADGLRCVVGVAEELPFSPGCFAAVYSGGCLHHTVTGLSLPEIARVLAAGGKFGAVDPWKAPLHTLGTRLLGKRERDVFCRPLTPKRVEPLRQSFQRARIIQHGSLTRYPLLALNKMGLSCSLMTAWHVNRADDSVCSILPGFRRMGSSVALLGTKGPL